MSAYEMLVKCGYSPSEAERISGQKRPILTQREIAEANEARYQDAPMSAEERLMIDKIQFDYERYAEVDNRCVNIGYCTTRRGVARRLKFGKGNIGRKAFLRKGFEQNDGGAQ